MRQLDHVRLIDGKEVTVTSGKWRGMKGKVINCYQSSYDKWFAVVQSPSNTHTVPAGCVSLLPVEGLEPTRYCKKCDKSYPITSFYKTKNKKYKHGIKYECKVCRATKNKKAYGLQVGLGYIYVVKLDACIKVGFSKDLVTRLKTYETCCMRVDLLYQQQGTINQELSFHKKFGKGFNEKYPLEDEENIINNLKYHLCCLNNILC